MKNFIIKSLLFLLSWILFFWLFFIFVDGGDDPFYSRFTTKKQSSLIIGDSRSAQGILPSILNEKFENISIYNYSFSNDRSPFGKIYLESIKRKLDRTDGNGIFLISVTPYSICSRLEDPNKESIFRENNLELSNKFVTLRPNFPFLLKFYNKRFYNIFRKSNDLFLHSDGWLEVTVPMDSLSVIQRTKMKLDLKNKTKSKWNFSSVRLDYLSKTIDYLNNYGTVYLVRLPIDPEMRKIENQILPNFEKIINSLSFKKNIRYLSLLENDNQFLYTDGNHLYSESAKIVTQIIAEWIN
tara:strand:- start:29 stop:919 length:891 start_codon:yes stop_codon:yes gene_type:complete